ncbi:unnamed protein product [Withania somnifera]
MENAQNSPNSEPELKSRVVKTGQISTTTSNINSSSIKTRSQTGVIVVHKEAEAEAEAEAYVHPKKQTLNFMSKKSRVCEKIILWEKLCEKKQLKNGNAGIIAYLKKREVYDDDDKEKEKSLSEDLKIGNFYVRPNRHYHPRIGAQTNVEAVNFLKEKLDAKQIQLFRETCFGHFLDLPPVVVQNQLMHSLLLREVVEEEDDVLWISVKGVRLRFGLVEFGTITGLKCTGDADKCYDSSGTGHLINTYFSSELNRVPKQSLIECVHNKRWKSDDDAVKIAVLYFIHTFLFSTLKCKNISREDFELVESGAYETYPWGKAVFEATLKSMKGKLQEKPLMYRLGGLPLAFQCWFYECCPYVNNVIAYRVDDKVPRILNWKVTRQPTFKGLFNGIFRQRQDQLKLGNITPTEFEKTTLGLPESIENDRVNKVASGDVAEVHVIYEDISNPPPASRKQRKTKHKPLLNNDDWSTESKRLLDRQSELKSEIQMLNEELASLSNCMRASFAKVFKAIRSLSKKQGEKTASELDGGNDPHDRYGGSYCSEFSEDNGSEGQGHGKDSIGDKDNNEKANEGTIGNVEGEETLGDPVKEVERMDVSETQILPDTCEVSDHIISEQLTKPSDKEVERMDVSETQILSDTCEVSDHIIPERLTKPSDPAPVLESPHVNQDDTGVEGSSKKSSNIIDNVDYSLLTEFDKWVDEGVKIQSKQR